MEAADAARKLGSLGGKATAKNHDKSFYQERAKHMNEVIKRRKQLQKDPLDNSANV